MEIPEADISVSASVKSVA